MQPLINNKKTIRKTPQITVIMEQFIHLSLQFYSLNAEKAFDIVKWHL